MNQRQDQNPDIHSRTLVALAILQQGNQFLMQLRDDDPRILYPGHWGFFCGHIEPGESADHAVKRELIEELGYCPRTLELFICQEERTITRYIYHGYLEASLSELILGEGIDLALLNSSDIERGHHFSEKLNQARPLGQPHRAILLQFIADRGDRALTDPTQKFD